MAGADDRNPPSQDCNPNPSKNLQRTTAQNANHHKIKKHAAHSDVQESQASGQTQSQQTGKKKGPQSQGETS